MSIAEISSITMEVKAWHKDEEYLKSTVQGFSKLCENPVKFLIVNSQIRVSSKLSKFSWPTKLLPTNFTYVLSCVLQ